MKKPILLAAIIASAGLMPSSSNALSYGEYRALKLAGAAVAEMIVGTIGQSYVVANAVLLYRKQEPLFCAPTDKGLTGNDYDALLAAYLELGEPPEDALLELLMLEALVDKYPC